MRVILLFYLLLIFTGSVTSQPLIGFCWVSAPLSDMALFEEGFAAASAMGCEIEHRQYNWDEIEKDKTTYDWTAVNQWYTTCVRYEIVPSIALCPLNSNSMRRNFPKDLEGKPFDDPEVIFRLQKFTELLLQKYPEIAYVSFGNEINYYLKSHEDEVAPYLRMCLKMYQYVKENYPRVRVLVIFGFTGMSKREEDMISQFLPACDVLGISSYHVSVSLTTGEPRLTEEEMRAVLKYCITLCGGKRFAIVETAAFSYPDPAYQARYVHVFFDIIREYENDMEFACWFLTYDWYPGTLTMIDPFLEQFSSAGLLETDGTPKLSYYAWMEEMSQYKGVSGPSRITAFCLVVVILLAVLKMK